MDALFRHNGLVAVLYHDSLRFVVEAIQQFSPNIVNFQLATGEQQGYIIRCYLSPDNSLTIKCIFAALR